MGIFDWFRDLISSFLPEELQDEAGAYVDQAEQSAGEQAQQAQTDYLG